MQCGFCARPIHVIEDYIYLEGLAFHPQRPAEDNIHCAPRVRAFGEEIVMCPEIEIGAPARSWTMRGASAIGRG